MAEEDGRGRSSASYRSYSDDLVPSWLLAVASEESFQGERKGVRSTIPTKRYVETTNRNERAKDCSRSIRFIHNTVRARR
jgi:hypothetical protein